jgi:hypothetical protein
VAIKSTVKLAEKSAKYTAEFMTKDVREIAHKHGWDKKSTNSLSVKYEKEAFNVVIDPKHERTVMDLEYGTETTYPTAVVRKYKSSTGKAEEMFIKSLEKELKVKL